MIDKSHFVQRDVTNPVGLLMVYRDFYWMCVEGDPKRALFYRPDKSGWGSPQCNASLSLMEALEKKRAVPLSEMLGAKIVRIPLAFVPWECSNGR